MKGLLWVIDIYLAHPIIFDLIACIMLCVGLHYGASSVPISSSDLGGIQSSLASTAVSLSTRWQIVYHSKAVMLSLSKHLYRTGNFNAYS